MKYLTVLLSVLIFSLLANARPPSTSPAVDGTSSRGEHELVRPKRSQLPSARAPETGNYVPEGVEGNAMPRSVRRDKPSVNDGKEPHSHVGNGINNNSLESGSSAGIHTHRTRLAMEPVAKRFHAHNRHPRSRVFSKRDAPTDIDILNFALTMGYLDAAFYKRGLEKYGAKEFRHAGYPNWIRRRYEQLAKNKRTHVEFLQSALGDRAVKPCAYSFPEKDIEQWVSISFVIETVGTSAWNGFVANLESREYRTVVASMMGVNARHAAWINSVVRKENPWNTPFETPLDMNQIYTIVSPYIVPGSCPSTNAPLRVTPFPTLHVPPSSPGSIITLEFDSSAVKEAQKERQQLFAAFVSGTGTVFVLLQEWKKVEIPKGLVGFVYVYITKDGAKVGNEGIVAGPGVVWFEFRA